MTTLREAIADAMCDVLTDGPLVALWRTPPVRWLRGRVERWAGSWWP